MSLCVECGGDGYHEDDCRERQPGLFDRAPKGSLVTNPEDAPTIQAAFEAFHAAHPEVYAELVMRARQWKAKGKARLGIGMLWEVMRWNLTIDRSDDDPFKLNNNHRSRFARKIMENEPDLAGIFETRELKS